MMQKNKIKNQDGQNIFSESQVHGMTQDISIMKQSEVFIPVNTKGISAKK